MDGVPITDAPIVRDPLALPLWPRDDPQRQGRFLQSYLTPYARDLATIEAFGGVLEHAGWPEISEAAEQIVARHKAAQDVATLAAAEVWREAQSHADALVHSVRMRVFALIKEGRSDRDLADAATRAIEGRGAYVPQPVLLAYLRTLVYPGGGPPKRRR